MRKLQVAVSNKESEGMKTVILVVLLGCSLLETASDCTLRLDVSGFDSKAWKA
jgi:hypothetical protein